MPGLVEPEMRNYLSSSTLIDGEFYLGVATQDATMPYGVVTKISPGRQYTHDGHSLSETRMQCSCFGDNYQEAKVLAGSVISEMEAWPSSTNDVQAVFLAGESDMLNDNVHHVALDFFVWHTF